MEVIKSKEVGFMNKDELLSVLDVALEEEGVQTIEQLFEFLKTNKAFKNDVANKAYLHFLRKELATKASRRPEFFSSKEVGNYLAEKYSDLKQENFIVLSIDNVNHIISEDLLFIGSINRATVSPRDVFRIALANNAAGIFVCHNHPSGKLMPSSQDLEFTNRLKEAGKAMDINVLDHFIVGNGEYLSMRELNIF